MLVIQYKYNANNNEIEKEEKKKKLRSIITTPRNVRRCWLPMVVVCLQQEEGCLPNLFGCGRGLRELPHVYRTVSATGDDRRFPRGCACKVQVSHVHQWSRGERFNRIGERGLFNFGMWNAMTSAVERTSAPFRRGCYLASDSREEALVVVPQTLLFYGRKAVVAPPPSGGPLSRVE